MDIERFKRQHVEILQRIDALRTLVHAGIDKHAAEIARHVHELGTVVKLHLAIEDRILYPAAQGADNTQIAAMAKAYQEEMTGIATPYIRFTNQWSDAARVAASPEDFRAQANTVLKNVYQRMQRENHEFYPALESM